MIDFSAALSLFVALPLLGSPPDAAIRAPATPALQAQEEQPRCSELDKRTQLRGRIDRGIVAAAGRHLNLPMGAGRFVWLNGKRYAFCLEPHYHPPGFSRGPEGWHKGVTVYGAP
jgi:hypothetical protein